MFTVAVIHGSILSPKMSIAVFELHVLCSPPPSPQDLLELSDGCTQGAVAPTQANAGPDEAEDARYSGLGERGGSEGGGNCRCAATVCSA